MLWFGSNSVMNNAGRALDPRDKKAEEESPICGLKTNKQFIAFGNVSVTGRSEISKQSLLPIFFSKKFSGSQKQKVFVINSKVSLLSLNLRKRGK